jgi:hypothetical protein
LKFLNLFKKGSAGQVEKSFTPKLKENYQSIDPFIDVVLSDDEVKKVTLIAASIAAGDYPKTKFKLKSIRKENPEFKRISLITASIAAGTQTYSSFKIKSIKKLNQEG